MAFVRDSVTSAESGRLDGVSRLAGKTAVVTGGARGIGAEVASRFAREGATTYVIDVASSSDKRWLRADVSDEASIEDAMEAILRESGRLDICVANAGISPTITHVTDLDLDTWRSVINVNLTGVFLTLRAAGRRMVRAGHGGRLIASGSVGSLAGVAGGAAYASAKFGLRGLIQSMALELAPSVTVNLIAPGDSDSNMNTQVRELIARARGVSADDIRAEMESRIPAGRLATPAEIAGAFAYLASDEAAYVTGSVLLIDGGWLLAR
jgi:NAD(P)-dependent dehydrogenase (short-subunit alcohol dehydrogenase family)